jgi:hypothetical protein
MDPIIKKYFDIIKAATGDTFRAYYYGDPVRIPTSMTPAIIGARRATKTVTDTNAEDRHNMTLVFTVVADVRSDIQDDKTLVAGNQRIYDLIEGRDPATLQLKPTSLLYILRHNQAIDESHQVWTDISTPSQVDYGLIANKRASPSWSIEGAITTTASLVQLR